MEEGLLSTARSVAEAQKWKSSVLDLSGMELMECPQGKGSPGFGRVTVGCRCMYLVFKLLFQCFEI